MAHLTTKATLPVTRPRIAHRQPGGPFRYIVPAFILIAIFFIVPVVMLLLRSVLEPVPGLENYATLFGSTT